jgi:hypothetical protein
MRSSNSATGSGVYSQANSLAVQVPRTLMKEGSFAFDDEGLEDQTSYGGDSTSVGRSEQDKTEGKDSDVAVSKNDELRNNNDAIDITLAVVDHTPSDMGDPVYTSFKDPSIQAQRSEVNTRATCDADSTSENIVYGPMVDQTPNTPSASVCRFSTDSVVV